MIDAEHSYFQPAIDHTTKALMRRYNTKDTGAGRTSSVVVFNTYQVGCLATPKLTPRRWRACLPVGGRA